MTYSEFTLDTVLETFGLHAEQTSLFPVAIPCDVPQWLTDLLEMGKPFARGSEKSRSEFIVAPILLAVRTQNNNAVAIYSGQRLDVDPASGLVGECDFLLSYAPPLPVVQAPIICVVEAKKHDIEAGLGQCAAQMVGTLRFNQKKGREEKTVFGCVTTGDDWQFMKLEQETITIDLDRYYRGNVGSILGVFHAIIAYYYEKGGP